MIVSSLRRLSTARGSRFRVVEVGARDGLQNEKVGHIHFCEKVLKGSAIRADCSQNRTYWAVGEVGIEGENPKRKYPKPKIYRQSKRRVSCPRSGCRKWATTRKSCPSCSRNLASPTLFSAPIWLDSRISYALAKYLEKVINSGWPRKCSRNRRIWSRFWFLFKVGGCVFSKFGFYLRKNVNADVETSLKSLEQVTEAAKQKNIRVRGLVCSTNYRNSPPFQICFMRNRMPVWGSDRSKPSCKSLWATARCWMLWKLVFWPQFELSCIT